MVQASVAKRRESVESLPSTARTKLPKLPPMPWPALAFGTDEAREPVERRLSKNLGTQRVVSLGAAAAIVSHGLAVWAQAVPAEPVQKVAVGSAPSEPNRPPSALQILPARFDVREIHAVIGKSLRFTLISEDPDGQAVQMRALGLPPMATFDEVTATFAFTPSPAQKGEHVVRFLASDGRVQTQRMLVIRVTDNHPPKLDLQDVTLSIDTPRSIGLKSESSDVDSDDLTIAVANLPKGATFDAGNGVIRWRPTEDDLGEHHLTVTVSDGLAQTVAPLKLEVVEAQQEAKRSTQWESFLLPGIGYSGYLPRDRDHFGTYHGVALEILLGAWIHRNNNRGPSHGRIYVQAELMQSTKSEITKLFGYALGFSLSLERNPHRQWLLPVYGLDVGGIISESTGGYFQALPYAGLHVYSSPNVFINLRGGYRFVPRAIERLGGAHLGATLDYSIW
jgi:hypothetical protein